MSCPVQLSTSSHVTLMLQQLNARPEIRPQIACCPPEQCFQGDDVDGFAQILGVMTKE